MVNYISTLLSKFKKNSNISSKVSIILLIAIAVLVIANLDFNYQTSSEYAHKNNELKPHSFNSKSLAIYPQTSEQKFLKTNLDSDPLSELKKIIDNPSQVEFSSTQLEHAAEVLDFTNQAQEWLSKGWLAQADLIAFFIQIYQGEWQLPLLPPTNQDSEAIFKNLLPKESLLGSEAYNYLALEIQKMEVALKEMLKDYQALAEYVIDANIQDEGIKGQELSKAILESYAQFKTSRQNYGELIDEEARTAEDIFLAKEPLRRQIMAARSIFNLFQEVSWSLAEGKPRDYTRKLAKQLKNLLDYAAAPPFKDKPLKERSYREFLKQVENYREILDQGNEEGFYSLTRKNLNDVLIDCRTAYNQFASLLNTQ